MSLTLSREAVPEPPNPLGLAGIEFVEYSTPRPQALGQLLETLGFRPVARHRSREVLLYRQGSMNVVINGHGQTSTAQGAPETPQIAAVALRVRDAAAAWQHVVDLGAWPVPVDVRPMELHIPGVHGVGASRIYFVDRWRDDAATAGGRLPDSAAAQGADGNGFSVYDVDFVAIPTVQREVPASAGLHWFGIVQYVGAGRSADWRAFYGSLFGFHTLREDQRFGILPSGQVLASPCGTFYLQLIEPEPGATELQAEEWQRVALGAPDVPAAVRLLRQRGVTFVDDGNLQPSDKGALTRSAPGGAVFELVHHEQR